MERRRIRRRAAGAAVLVVVALVAVACGSGKSSSGGSPQTTSAQQKQDLLANKATGEAADTGTPVPGGKLVYGIEADSANPWVHYATSCAISCRMIFRAISDPLFMADKDGKISPYLLKSADHSADFKTWTFVARDGITFHDGTPLDGAAVAYNIDVLRFAPLTGPIYGHIDKVTSSGQSVTITLKVPDASLPALYRDEGPGYMFSPKWMRTLESNPLRKLDPSRVDPPTGKQAEPVGLGPFKYKSYTPGNGNAFVAVKNENYWRKAEGLPYLDEIDFVVAVDIQSRSNGLRSGQFNIIHTSNSDEAAKFDKERDKFRVIEANAYGETNYIMLNVAEGTNPTYAAITGKDGTMDPKGANANSPLLKLSCRKALAEAIDLDRYAKERGAGLVKPANGPFPQGSLGYLDDSGYPKFNVKAAQADMDTCLKDVGKPNIEFTFNTTNDPFNVESNQLIISMWKDAFGDKVKTSVTPVEQGQYIGLALVGNFNAFGWRNHGGIDPAEQYLWWVPATASPIGQLALNFGRFQDKTIADNLNTLRSTDDPAKRKAAAEAVNRQFGSQVYNWWTTWTLWTIAASPKVHSLTNLKFPDGASISMPVVSGKHQLTQIWCDGGKCP